MSALESEQKSFLCEQKGHHGRHCKERKEMVEHILKSRSPKARRVFESPTVD